MVRYARPGLRPEEKEATLALQGVFSGVEVERHDDGSEASQYDLSLSGPVCGAVEVGLVTDVDIRRAQAHWRRVLEAHRTADLKWSWTFLFSEASDSASPLRFPHLARPASTELAAVLARLEVRGIMQVGRMWDHVAVQRGGWRIADPDMADLFGLLGRTAEYGSAVDLSDYGEVGGWSFAFAFGHTSSADPDRFAAEVESLVREPTRADTVAKLDRSEQPVKVAALVFDSTTGVGWSTSHLPPGTIPTAGIDLPSGITHVLVLGMNGFTMLYSGKRGWSRHDVPTEQAHGFRTTEQVRLQSTSAAHS